MPSPTSDSAITGVFESAVDSRGTRSHNRHGALYAGSSKQGNARRARVGSNCVIAYHASPSFSAKIPLVVFRLCSASNVSVIRCRPDGSGRIEREPDELIVSCDDPRLRAVGRDGRARDVNVVCVEPQHVVRPRHRDVDGYLARDLRLTGDDRQGRFVAKRSRALRQPQRRWREGRRRGRLRERSARGQRERAGEDAQPRRRQSSGEHMITASGP